MGLAVDAFVTPPHIELQCGVCGDVMEDPMETDCSHYFCSACLTRWFATSSAKTCPVCRAAVARLRNARGKSAL